MSLLATAPRAGMVSQAVKADAAEVTLRLGPEVVIHGRLLTPSGMPATGVRVTLNGFHNDQTQAGMYRRFDSVGRGDPALLAKAAKDRCRRPVHIRRPAPGDLCDA